MRKKKLTPHLALLTSSWHLVMAMVMMTLVELAELERELDVVAMKTE